MPFTNIAAAYDAIMGHLKTEWATSSHSSVPIDYPDKKMDTPSDQSAWLRVLIQHKLGYQATFQAPGSRRFRSKGTVTVEVRTPLGDGLTTSQALTDTLQSIFEGRTTGPDQVIFRQVVPVEFGPDGPWFLVNVRINFEYDRFR